LELEIDDYLEKVLIFEPEVDSSDQFVEDFTKTVKRLVRHYEETFLEIFNSPIPRDSL